MQTEAVADAGCCLEQVLKYKINTRICGFVYCLIPFPSKKTTLLSSGDFNKQRFLWAKLSRIHMKQPETVSRGKYGWSAHIPTLDLQNKAPVRVLVNTTKKISGSHHYGNTNILTNPKLSLTHHSSQAPSPPQHISLQFHCTASHQKHSWLSSIALKITRSQNGSLKSFYNLHCLTSNLHYCL